MGHKITDEMVDELYRVVSGIKSKEECKNLFDDLCTYKEIMQMAQRLWAAKLLTEGYKEVYK